MPRLKGAKCYAPASDNENVTGHEVIGNTPAYKHREQTRSGLKRYACKYCKKCFNRSKDCKDHERIHTGEKPYTCKHCNESFSQSSNCKTHERTHTGENLRESR